MPALAERTKIRTGNDHTPVTTPISFYGVSYLYGHSIEPAIDINIHQIASASTRFQTIQYLDPSEKAKDMLRKIYRFKDLPENWDGKGAIAPTDSLINCVASFLISADEYDLPVYFSAPGPNGEIVLEYKMGNFMAEVFFENDKAYEMILYNGKVQEYAGKVSLKRMIDHFRTAE